MNVHDVIMYSVIVNLQNIHNEFDSDGRSLFYDW